MKRHDPNLDRAARVSVKCKRMTASLRRVQVVEGREISVALVFEHETKGQRVLFGTGLAATHLAAETKRIGANRPFVVAGRPA